MTDKLNFVCSGIYLRFAVGGFDQKSGCFNGGSLLVPAVGKTAFQYLFEIGVNADVFPFSGRGNMEKSHAEKIVGVTCVGDYITPRGIA